MNWISISVFSYFLVAIAVVLDKFLLSSGRISKPHVYSFYIGVLGLGSLILLPFGFYIPSKFQIFTSLISGIFFTLGILVLYFAIRKSRISQVAPLAGAVIPVFSYLFSFALVREYFGFREISGIVILILGGLLISFDLPFKMNKRKFFSGFYQTIFSSILLALAYSIFKYVYEEQTFINGFIWTRFGMAICICSFFLIPQWRKDIIESLKRFKNPEKIKYQTGILFLGNKIIAGTGSLLINYAISLGSVTLVSSLASIQYAFVIFLSILASGKYPSIFNERILFWDWMQKFGAILVIAAGIYLVSGSIIYQY